MAGAICILVLVHCLVRATSAFRSVSTSRCEGAEPTRQRRITASELRHLEFQRQSCCQSHALASCDRPQREHLSDDVRLPALRYVARDEATCLPSCQQLDSQKLSSCMTMQLRESD
eukprot:3331412-Rhodomonas_salina.2